MTRPATEPEQDDAPPHAFATHGRLGLDPQQLGQCQTPDTENPRFEEGAPRDPIAIPGTCPEDPQHRVCAWPLGVHGSFNQPPGVYPRRADDAIHGSVRTRGAPAAGHDFPFATASFRERLVRHERRRQESEELVPGRLWL